MVQVFDDVGVRACRSRAGRWLALAMVLLLAGCGGGEPPPVMAVPGLVWDVEADQGVKGDDLIRRLSRADVVLIGEVHDNPRHHQIEAELIRRLATSRQLRTVALEMLDREQQAELDRLWQQPADAGRVLQAMAFDERGWGAERYRPVVEAMLEAEVRPVAANLSRAEAGKVVRDGWGALFGEQEQTVLGLAADWDAAFTGRREQQLRDSHCNALPEEMMAGMLDAQRARDAVLADRVLAHAEAGVILIAGGEHARRDYGVPAYLARRAPALEVLSVLLVEVENAREVSAYLEHWPAAPEGAPYDYLWFTSRADRPDPCARFAKPAAPAREEGD